MKKFVKDTVERATKTAAQTAIAIIGVSATIGEVDWRYTLSAVALATVLSVLTSIASKPIGDSDSASVLKEVK
jgi:type IV secretory pathway VirB2 component (pilin)